MNVPINYLAVLLAAVASMVVGFIYYSPYVVGKPWMKLMGYGKDDMKPKNSDMARTYGTSFVLALLSAYVLTHIMFLSTNYFHESAVMTGLTSAFWLWLGFVMPVQLTEVLFSKKPLKLVLINTGYQLLSLLAMGVVIASV